MDYSFKNLPSCEAMLLIFEKEENYRNLKSFYILENSLLFQRRVGEDLKMLQ
jgi:hypothetical protein